MVRCLGDMHRTWTLIRMDRRNPHPLFTTDLLDLHDPNELDYIFDRGVNSFLDIKPLNLWDTYQGVRLIWWMFNFADR